MEAPLVFLLIISVLSCAPDDVHSQGLSASENPIPVGRNVTLSSLNQVTTGAWLFNNNIIVIIFPGNAVVATEWTGKVTYDTSTSSLTIMSLQVEDSGTYTLQDVGSNASQIVLSVQEPITGVTLTANASHLVEFNDTAVLTCAVSTGTSLSFTWLNDTSELTADGNVQISEDGSQLTIAEVTRYDQGPFKCNVFNGISQGIDQQVSFDISYGPTNPKVSVTPLKDTHITGSDITLSCSAESKPDATIQWLVDGVSINHSDPQLQLTNVTETHSGDYQCLLHNSVTSRFISATAMISIMAPITAVMVNRTGGPAIADELFTLMCHVTGDFHLIQWWMNGDLVSADNTTVFAMGNKTLTLSPAQPSDAGDYQCRAYNAVSNMTSSPYTVEVYYGPSMPVITAPSLALSETQVVLNCSSTSHPPSQHTWSFNNTVVANASEYQAGPLHLNMSGTYTCTASNSITGKNSTADHMLTVLDPVTMASVTTTEPHPILNHTFTLTCETKGNVDSITWMHNGTILLSDGVRNLTMDNTTLTFDPILMSHNGNYTCVASNPLSSFMSEHFNMAVIYGPGPPTIMGDSVALVQSSVALICSAPSRPPSDYKWYFNNNIVANTSVYQTPPLTTNMSGTYTCKAQNAITGYNSTASTTLTVFDKLKDIDIEAPMKAAIEGYSFTLTCNVSGPAHQVVWMKNGLNLTTESRIMLSMDNITVTFDPLHRNDSGLYNCLAMNPVESMASPSHLLLVNFGPDTPMIDGPSLAVEGQSINFTCSVMTMPDSDFYWLHNGSIVANSSMLVLGNVSMDMKGEYTCKAKNPVTGMNSTKSLMLKVNDAISSVMVTNDSIPIDGNNFTLTCEVDAPYDSIQWKKDDVLLGMNMSTTNYSYYYMEKNKLHFTPLMLHNNGTYKCVARNLIGPHQSPAYELLVNYGPLSVEISGPEFNREELTFSMKCVADSYPEPEFQWFLNDLPSSAIGVGSIIQISVSLLIEANYTCKATNPVTNITMSKTKTFSLTGSANAIPSLSQKGLMIMGVFILSAPVLFQ
uniref:carcinoembryonic antigen-related cell adhesion molecule 5-like n=1 Tax=Doryrhamphus excisus TaxID=161450 RepID=UPI0025ADC16E|nr:carcinoembryonic antigen-related cell adhesion molecule 5-like [Doryrhamphus excisus]